MNIFSAVIKSRLYLVMHVTVEMLRSREKKNKKIIKKVYLLKKPLLDRYSKLPPSCAS